MPRQEADEHRKTSVRAKKPATSPELLSVSDVAQQYPFNKGSLRSLIFNANENGLKKAIIRIGRRVFLERSLFDEWILSHRER